MLRITKVETGNSHCLLKLEGRLMGPWVKELEKACHHALTEGMAVNLDLSEVSYVDRLGLVLLLALKRRAFSFEGCSPFVAEELREAERWQK
jgi:anti-anti-sigma regulatory factor